MTNLKHPTKSDFTDSLQNHLRDKKIRTILYFALLMALTYTTIRLASLWVSVLAIYFFYLTISLCIFLTIKPKTWEICIIPLLYLAIASLVIVFFGALSQAHPYIINPEVLDEHSIEDYIYYSATMFTSLGFSDYKPQSLDQKYFAIVQSMLGGAHSVIFLLIALGRESWENLSQNQTKHQCTSTSNSRIDNLEARLNKTYKTQLILTAALITNTFLLIYIATR